MAQQEPRPFPRGLVLAHALGSGEQLRMAQSARRQPALQDADGPVLAKNIS